MCLLAVRPHFEQNTGRMKSLAEWLLKKGLLSNARDRFASVERIFCMPNYACLSDIFPTIESWVNAYHDFDALDRSGTPYSAAVKQCAWLNSERLCNIVHALDALQREGALTDARFIGFTPEIGEIFAAYRGQNMAAIAVQPLVAFRRVINFTIAGALMAYTILWTLGRIRLGKIRRAEFLLGSTLALDPRLFKNLSDIPDNRGQVCVIYVLQREAEAAWRDLDTDGILFRQLWEGRLTPRQAASWLAEILGDYIRLARQLAHHRPALFLQGTKLPHYRMAFRTLFNRYRFSYFWGRDDHDQTHHMRSQELRRVGGVSMGINHGIPVSDIVEPGWRYIDFDHYYAFGRHLYERYYRHTWPAHMTVTAIGTFGLRREELHQIAVPRTKDIMVFANPTLDNDRLVDTALALARAFPDRHVFFKTKPWPKDHFFVELLETRQPLPANFKFINKGIEATYDLVMWCGYSISTISSVGAETVHLGARTFILDTQPPDYPLLYRDFDGLTFHEADEVITRIRNLETGQEEYPWSAYDGLADASGQDPFDRIRADMSLPPKSPGGQIEALRRTREIPIALTDTV